MRSALSLLALVACSQGPTPSQPVATPADAPLVDAPLDRDLPLLAQRSVKLYQDVVAAFAAAGEDCTAATSRLAELAKGYADVVAANAKVAQEGRSAELKAALAPHDAALSEAARSIMHSPTLAKCAQDPAFGAAWESLVAAN